MEIDKKEKNLGEWARIGHKIPEEMRWKWKLNKIGKNNPNWRGGKITIICQECQKEHYSYLSHNQKFCSRACHYKYKSKTWSNPWNRGKKCPQISIATKGRIPWNKDKKMSAEYCETISKSHKGLRRGDKNPNWRGGISEISENYRALSTEKVIKWRNFIFKRDSYTCKDCHHIGRRLEAHHIKSWVKYPELRYDTNNGVTLCNSCHKIYRCDGDGILFVKLR